jgi:hypothetical protein
LPDAGNANGAELGLDRVLNVFRKTSISNCMAKLKSLVATHTNNAKTHDDISVVIIHTDKLATWADKTSHPNPSSPAPSTALSNGWRLEMRLGATELKVLDPIPFVIDLLKKLQVTDAHLSSLFLIISELFNNALDHGLLKLDSAIKQGENGFENYLSLRGERLAKLSQDATLELEFENQISERSRRLKIRVKDSGEGFDHKTEVLGNDTELQHGRGISLVQKIADQVVYNPSGNEVIVSYSL